MRKILGFLAALMLFSVLAVSVSSATLTQVTELKATKASQTSVSLSWKAVSGADGYQIYAKSSTDTAYSKIITIRSGSTVKYVHTGLKLGETYSFKVRAWNKTNNTYNFGLFASAKIQLVPNTVTGFGAGAVGPKSVALTWQRGSGISGYTIFRSKVKTGPYKIVKNIGNYAITNWTDNLNLLPNTKYYYVVKTYKNYNGLKVYSADSSIKYVLTKNTGASTTAVVNASSVRLSNTNIKVTATKTYTISASLVPTNTTFKGFTYSSSDKTIATVSSTGVVKGVKAGTCTITVTSLDGKATATAKVTVRPFNGFFNDDNGYLRYNKNGVLLKSATINGIKFGENGTYSSGNTVLDSKIRKIIRENTNDNMTQKEKFKVLYYWIYNHFTYQVTEYINVGDTGWAPRRADLALNNNMGNCYSYAATLAMMGRALGFDVKEKSGYITFANGYVDRHGWCEIKENGITYLLDVQLESGFIRRNYLPWKMFYIDKRNAPIGYT